LEAIRGRVDHPVVLQNEPHGNPILHSFARAPPLSGSHKQAFGLSGSQMRIQADTRHLAHLLKHLNKVLCFLCLEAI
jgi:hypothetical protein